MSNERDGGGRGRTMSFMRWLVFFLLVGMTGNALWHRFGDGPSAPDHNKNQESLMVTMSRAMLGSLAAIPEPLEDDQLREITRNLDAAFENTFDGSNSTSYPVLFVPGLISSQLETKLTNRKKAHWWLPCFVCPKTTESYDRVWFFPETWWKFLPFVIDCYVEEMLVRWHYTDDTTQVPLPWRTGIDTRTKESFEAVMELDPNSPTYRFYAQWLKQYLGYQPGEQMIAQPFDWRLGPETWMKPGREFDQMKTAIELVVEKNQGRGVVAMSISAGGPFFALFLNRHVDQVWKDKYIHAWFSISAALSGSAIAPMQYISLRHNSFIPDNIPRYIIQAFGRIVSSTSSLSWLFPSEDSFHDTVISTPARAYRANELGAALEDAGYPDQAQLYLNNRQYYGGSNLVPGVHTICISGYGIDTLSGLHFNTTDMSDSPTVDTDDGDNCVTVEALRQCDAWAEKQDAPVHVHHYYNGSHAGLLYDADVVRRFFDVVVGKEEEEVVAFS